MFKYTYNISLIILFSFAISKAITLDTPESIKKYIQEEYAKTVGIKKVNRILESAKESFTKNGGLVDEIQILNDFNDLIEFFLEKNPRPFTNNPYIQLANALLNIHYETSEETIEKIIETNDDCLKEMSKFKQLDLKNFLTCIKLSLLAHTNN